MRLAGAALLALVLHGTAFAQDPEDTTLVFPIQNNYDPTQTINQSFDLGDPSSVERTIVYDPVTGTYIFTENIGETGLHYRHPSMMTLEEYLEYERQKSMADNWKERIDEQTEETQPFELPIEV